MKLIRIVKTLGPVFALFMTCPALGATYNFAAHADGSVEYQSYAPTGVIDRDGSVIHTSTGAPGYIGIYEFDVSPIPQGAEILGASLSLTLASISDSFGRLVTNSYVGDGFVDPSDYSIADGSFIGGRDIDANTPAGTELTFSALPGDNLDILQTVVDTDATFFGVKTSATLGHSFVDFYSLESAVALPILTIETADVAPVPVPAALPLFASAIGIFGLFNRKRRKG